MEHKDDVLMDDRKIFIDAKDDRGENGLPERKGKIC